MKSNFSLKYRTFDTVILLFAIIFIIASIVFTNLYFANSKKSQNRVVQIYYQGQLLEDKQIDFENLSGSCEVTLSKLEYDKLLGDMVILIDKEKGICVKDVTCPNKICKNQGYVKSIGYPIVCLPNGVYIIINAKKVDQDTILG